MLCQFEVKLHKANLGPRIQTMKKISGLGLVLLQLLIVKPPMAPWRHDTVKSQVWEGTAVEPYLAFSALGGPWLPTWVTKSRTSSWEKALKKCKTLRLWNVWNGKALTSASTVSNAPALFRPTGSVPTMLGPTALLDAWWTTEGSKTSSPAAQRSFDSFPLKAWHAVCHHL